MAYGAGAAPILAYIGTAAAVAGAAVTTYTAIQKSEQDAAIAKSNQKAADTEAQARLDAAAFSEQQFRRRAAIVLGKQRAITAASGVDPTSGSPMLQELDSVRQAELEALNIRRQGDVGAATSRFEGGIFKMRGRFASGQIPGQIAGGAFSAGESILSQWERRSRSA